MDKLVKTLGIRTIEVPGLTYGSRPDEHVTSPPSPLHDAGSFTFVAADALTMKVREVSGASSRAVLVATGVNNDAPRSTGVRVSTSETGLERARRPGSPEASPACAWSPATRIWAWSAFIAANLPEPPGNDAAPIAANLMSVTPKRYGPPSKAMLHSVYDQPDAASVNAHHDRLLTT